MNLNERFLNILEILGIEVNDFIKNGKLIKYELLSDDKTIRVTLEFDKLISLNDIKPILEKIKEYVINNLSASDCRFTIRYVDDSIEDELIYDYYNDGIELLSPVQQEISILKRYNVSINNRVLCINVPNEEEQKVVLEELELLKRYMVNYGITRLLYEVNIDYSVYDIRKQKDLEVLVQEKLDSAKNEELYQQKVLTKISNTSSDSYYAKYNKQRFPIKISDIPLTSMELEEFKQINLTEKVNASGILISIENRHITGKNGNEYDLFTGSITDYKDTILVKRFYKENEKDFFQKSLKTGTNIEIDGTLQFDNYANAVVIMCNKIIVKGPDTYRIRIDKQEEKRVELHAHSKMSVLDSILNIDEYVSQAKMYGHKALAITDHENCHVLPEFFKYAKKAGIKAIAGVECNYVDLAKQRITNCDDYFNLNDATFVVFDIETTGFWVNYHEIIEIGAMKVKNGIVLDTFSQLIKPKKRPSAFIERLTNITYDMLFNALTIDEVLPEFKKFIEGCVLVGHNVAFDIDFIYENMKRLGIYEHTYPTIDTLMISRAMYSLQGLKRFKLEYVAKFLKVDAGQAHRALGDVETTVNIFTRMLGDLKNQKITDYHDLNKIVNPNEIYKYVIPKHLNIIVKNRIGLKNMYKIISDSHTKHYAHGAVLVDTVLKEYRNEILVGSGCVNGIVFRTALEKNEEALRKEIAFFDYIEVQPPCVYKFLYEDLDDEDASEYIKDTIKLIIRVAKEEGKLVCATGDVHELIKEDSEYRKIYLSVARPNGGGPHELNKYKPLDMHFLSTTEMLEAFNFLPNELAYEIVIANPNKINDMIESYELFPKDLFIPSDDFRKNYGIPSMKQAIYDLCDKSSHAIYGDVIPLYVKERLDTELSAIIGHGYFSVYYISHLLVKDSNDHGYVVGSRGSVGSSFVATMMNITEVNALKPHYVCPKCHFSAFKFTESEKQKYQQFNVPKYLEDILNNTENGFDLPIQNCPNCGEIMSREGMNIAFETFLGFTGDKCPDIDLNFSGEYQARAHSFVQEVFGKEYAYRAGTISTVMDKTAYAYVRDYYVSQNIEKKKQELERLALFLTGSKKTTGQHPGGIVVVPDYIDIYDVTPIQFPPVTDKDDLNELQWRTTHFDYHTFEANLLKLDILGHDDPTVIKKLVDYAKDRPNEFSFSTVEGIPFIDDKVISLFSSKEALQISGDDYDNFTSGTIGLPEFGTNFVRGMLNTINPKTYNDIIKVSGLSHGTDVWQGNAETLVSGTGQFEKIAFSEIIGCRDDIMIYLIKKGVEAAVSFKIMEAVRKGKGLTDEQIEKMKEKNVPDWFIWSCKKIKYLFPKAHAVAYVIMSLRIGWFKVHKPIYYYAVYFSVRAKELDAEIFASGKNAIRNKLLEIDKKRKNHEEVTNKEDNLYDELKIALEMILRGYSFKQIDVTHSDATNFVISDDRMSLYLPFVAIPSLGESVAKSVVIARNERPFTSKKDFERRTAINKTQYAKLKLLGVFDELPDDDVEVLFDF